MQTFYDQFKELSDKNLLERINRKEHYQREAVLAAFHILQQRGYNFEHPFPDSDHILVETISQKKRKSFLEREYHVWHKKVSEKKSLGRIILFIILFVPSLWYSNSYLNETNLFRQIHLATQTILSYGGITYVINIVLIAAFFLNSKKSLSKFLYIKPRHLYVAIKVFLFSIIVISIWEWVFSSRVTVTLIFDDKSPRELLKNLWFGALIAFTEELIFKWLLLSQLLLRTGDSATNRRLIFTLVSILFAIVHIPIQISDYGGINAAHLILTFFYSYFTSILYVKHRNLLLVILIHFFVNIPVVFIENSSRFFIFWSIVLVAIYCIPRIGKSWLFKSKDRYRIPAWAFPGLMTAVTLLILLTPKQPRDYFNYSKQYYYMNSYEQAMESVNTALIQEQQNAEFLNHKGNIFYSLDSYDSAWIQYDNAVKLDSTFYSAIRNRGLAAKQISKYSECIEDLTIAVMEGIQTSRVYQNRGSCYLGIDEPELAISDFEQAIKKNSTNDQAYYGLGRSYLKMKDFDKALENLETAIALDPNFVEAYEVLAIAYTGLKRYDSSNAVMTKAIEMGSKSPIRFYLRGVNYYEKEDYYNAIKEFEKSIEFNPDEPDLYLKLAYSYFFLEDYMQGCQYLNKSAFLGSEQARNEIEYYCEKSP